MILGGSTATEDEVRSTPDAEGSYGPLGGLLAETAVRLRPADADRRAEPEPD